jgi:hypothetical protein
VALARWFPEASPSLVGVEPSLLQLSIGFWQSGVIHLAFERLVAKILNAHWRWFTIGLAEPMGGVTRSGVLGWAKEREGSQSGSKSSRWLLGYTNMNHASKMEPSRWDPSCEKSNHGRKINAPSCWWSTMTGVHPWIRQENFKTKILASMSYLTWLRAAVRKLNSGTDVPGIWQGAKGNSCIRLFPLSNGYLHTPIR